MNAVCERDFSDFCLVGYVTWDANNGKISSYQEKNYVNFEMIHTYNKSNSVCGGEGGGNHLTRGLPFLVRKKHCKRNPYNLLLVVLL